MQDIRRAALSRVQSGEAGSQLKAKLPAIGLGASRKSFWFMKKPKPPLLSRVIYNPTQFVSNVCQTHGSKMNRFFGRVIEEPLKSAIINQLVKCPRSFSATGID